MNAQRLLGVFASFGASAAGKLIKPDSITLQGNSGTWVTIDAGEYYVNYTAGFGWQRDFKDDATSPNWSGYASYRVNYTVYDNGTETTYTNEAIAFAAEANAQGDVVRASALGANTEVDAAAARNLVAQFLYVLYGRIAGTLTMLAAALPGTAWLKWVTSAGTLVGDLVGSVDGSNTQGIMALEAYGPDNANHLAVAGVAAYDKDGTRLAVINLRSNSELRLILNSGNGQTIGVIPSFYARDTTGGVTVQNTAVETTIFSVTIKQNALGPNGIIKFSHGGQYQNNVTNTITFKVKFGSTTLCTITRSVPAAGAGTGAYVLNVHVDNAGNVAVQNAWADLVTYVGSTDRTGADYGTGAEDTSAADKLLIITAKWTTADTSSGIFSKGGSVLLAYQA
ncbi:MAG: hypothetical protein WCF84_02360 [Anaerolineae bacterium]